MEQNVRLIIAYGNPGRKYAKARSNVGYMVIDSAVLKAVNIFPTATVRNWEIRSKYMILAANLDPFTFVVKPRTFEDKFDDTAFSLYSFYKVKPEDFYIIYPDETIALGQYTVSKERGSAPDAISKIEKKAESQDFWKVRMGIGGAHEELTDPEFVKIKYLGRKLAEELKIVHII